MFESIHQTKEGLGFPVEITAQYVEFDNEKKVLNYRTDNQVKKQRRIELFSTA